ETLVEVFGLILKHHPRGGSPSKLLIRVINRTLKRLGPYSRFMTRSQFQNFKLSLAGKYQGIGIEMVRRQGGIFVRRVETGSPAAKKGLRPGNRIVSIDGRQVGQDLSLAGRLLRGRIGTVLRVGWEDNRGRFRRAAVRRAKIVRHDVEYFVWKDVLVLKIHFFQPTTDNKVKRVLVRYAGRRRLLLDLRDNQGGDLDAAVKVADMLAPPGLELIRVTYRTETRKFISRQKPLISRYPVYILVNNDTASASELLAAALRYRKLAFIIGSPTRGKGVVSEVFPLLQGHGLLLTVGVIKTPDGATYNRRGLRVDLAISAGPLTSGDDVDAVLDRALQWLGRTARRPSPAGRPRRRLKPVKSNR
ncbi:MAG: PDZ domain-containing protein, partial [Proteobacteria bacterium]|nr:PDZ domain-containing protein [Pseudomonadota bacterium]